jgi:hypothetical protein
MLGEHELADKLVQRMPKGFPVWPDNMAVADAWLAVCTQWNATSMANGQVFYHGLNYAGVGQSLDRAEITLTAGQWSSLRMMERIAAAVLNGNRG